MEDTFYFCNENSIITEAVQYWKNTYTQQQYPTNLKEIDNFQNL